MDSLEADAFAKIEAQFRDQAAGRIDADKLHWISRYGRSDATVAEYARMYDVTIVGRYDALSGGEHLELHPDRIALKSGRPVLVVPRGWQPDRIHEHAVVAWDGGRAVTRAVNDAMQILETKQLVTVLTVQNGGGAKRLEGIDIQTALQRHGIDVEMKSVPPGGLSVGARILAECRALDTGLLVMGAYEHSVFREELIGGATRDILRDTDRPVLIAH